MNPRRPQRRPRGITLIELMVAMAVVAILAAVAYPSYTSYVVRSNRSAAISCLTEQAQFMERVYVSNLRYDQNNAAATTLPALACSSGLSGKYTFSFPTGSLQQRTFSVQAVPQGMQASKDGGCGTLSLNQAGTKSVSGSSSAASCWR